MSMSDREMLELAAKAIGKVFVDPMSWEEGAGWNPLEDDGDALRLAVALSFSLVFDCYPPKARDLHRASFRIRIWALGWIKEELDSEEVKCAAVRRAIIRAAAEIGKAMQEQSK